MFKQKQHRNLIKASATTGSPLRPPTGSGSGSGFEASSGASGSDVLNASVLNRSGANPRGVKASAKVIFTCLICLFYI